jgi:hypothetical protein
VGRDLEAVVLKCLEKDPRRRYGTAKELADELGRYLSGEPVQARPAGLMRRGWRKVKQRPGRVLGALALVAALACLAAGWWYWDANYRAKVEYYATYTNRWGVPEGVDRVSEEEARHRNVTWKFTRNGGRVEKIEAVNGSGFPTAEHSPSAWLHRLEEEVRECSFEYPRNDRGEVLEEIARDRQGQVVWTFHYSTRTTGYYADKRGLPRARSGTGATYVEFVHTPEGFNGEVHYLDKEGEPQANHAQVFGHRSEFDERGLIVAMTFLNAQRQPAVERSGYTRLTTKYDKRGNPTEWAYFGVDGRPALHKDGFARATAKYDDHGKKTEVAYFGVDGRPALHKDGDARVTMKYDERGNKIEQAYFGVDGRPALHKDGDAGFTAKYDERGNKTEEAYFGLDGQPVLLKDGYAKVTWKYDERGNQTEVDYFGVDGRPALHKDGDAGFTAKYDERGNKTEVAYFGLDGQPVLHKDGNAGFTAKYDERGNRTGVAYFGVDGWPVLHKDGNAGFTAKYDERGNRTEAVSLPFPVASHSATRTVSPSWLVISTHLPVGSTLKFRGVRIVRSPALMICAINWVDSMDTLKTARLSCPRLETSRYPFDGWTTTSAVEFSLRTASGVWSGSVEAAAMRDGSRTPVFRSHRRVFSVESNSPHTYALPEDLLIAMCRGPLPSGSFTKPGSVGVNLPVSGASLYENTLSSPRSTT